jgi:hypothetical protein
MGFLVAVLLVPMGAATSHAAPFDLIVPTEVRLPSQGIIGATLNSWGWLIAASSTIPYSELVGATATGTITGGATIDALNHEIRNEFLFEPGGMAVGQVAGQDVRSALYAPLLATGEALAFDDLNLYDAGFLYPEGYIGTETFSATVRIGGDSLTYSTTIVIGDPQGGLIGAQRVSSRPDQVVPEPSSLLLLGTGLIGAVRAMRKRRG